MDGSWDGLQILIKIKKKISILISSKTIKDLNLVSLGRGEKRIISSAFHPE